MEPEIDSDTEALWQDMFDLVSKRHLPGSVMAMLRSCAPTSLDAGVLHVETHSRTVKNRLSKNLDVINECLTEAAFEPTTLDISFVQDPDAAPSRPKLGSDARGGTQMDGAIAADGSANPSAGTRAAATKPRGCVA
jgi:chromosomal replication initiator protein